MINKYFLGKLVKLFYITLRNTSIIQNRAAKIEWP